jgi:drug/metabolite transporter (DMT)-like permease
MNPLNGLNEPPVRSLLEERVVAVLWIAVTSALGVAGQTLAKIGLGRLDFAKDASFGVAVVVRMAASPLVWAGGALLVFGTLLWFHVLHKVEFSIAMPVGSLLQVVLSVVAARVCFGETIPSVRWFGFLLAVLAVWLIARPS